jgi:hypothetical protein
MPGKKSCPSVKPSTRLGWRGREKDIIENMTKYGKERFGNFV